MNEQLPVTSDLKVVRTPRVSRRLKRAIDIWNSGRAITRKAAAEKAGMSYDHFCRALKKPHIRSLLRERSLENIDAATFRASRRLEELVDADSEHVGLKASLRLAESAGFIRPAGNGAPVINQYNGPVGYCIKLTRREDRAEGIERPLTPDGQAKLDSWMRGETPGIVISDEDRMPSVGQSAGHSPRLIEHQRLEDD